MSITTIASAAMLIAVLISLYSIRSNFRLRSSGNMLQLEVGRRIQLEQQLLEKQNYLTAIIQTEPECVKLLSREGLVLDINPAGAALIDAEPAQVRGTCIYSVVAQQDQAHYRALTERVFRGESGILEFQIESPKGRMRWLETHAVPMRDAGGTVIALLGITRDITARKNSDEEVRRHHFELARVCRLVTVNEMALTLAHELNQPLCAITSYMESLRNMAREADGTSHERMEEIAGKAAAQAERAGQIIRRVREFASTRESGKLPSHINSLIQDVINICIAEARQRGVSVQLHLADELPTVLADPILIQQVILNLVRNGIEAMEELPDESGRLLVTTRRTDEDTVEVTIADNGCGLADAGTDSAFAPFYTTKPQGMGMGLSISRSIIKAHGGNLRLEADSQSGGTTAQFSLPVFLEEPA
jgi:PAS domain S-box-containing protein